MKFTVLRSSCWTVLRAPCAGACMSCVAERKIILSSTTCLITANICRDSKISHQYCSLIFHLRLDKEQLSLVLTQRPTSWRTWKTMCVCVITDDSMLYSLRRSCLVHTADTCENEGWFSCDQVIIWMCFVCLLAKQHSAFKQKTQFSACFPCSAEALVRWGGKIKCYLIAYFLGNISAKNCQNRSMFVEVIASQSSVVFWDTVYMEEFPPHSDFSSEEEILSAIPASQRPFCQDSILIDSLLPPKTVWLTTPSCKSHPMTTLAIGLHTRPTQKYFLESGDRINYKSIYKILINKIFDDC